jgi:hypothetical protein
MSIKHSVQNYKKNTDKYYFSRNIFSDKDILSPRKKETTDKQSYSAYSALVINH